MRASPRHSILQSAPGDVCIGKREMTGARRGVLRILRSETLDRLGPRRRRLASQEFHKNRICTETCAAKLDEAKSWKC